MMDAFIRRTVLSVHGIDEGKTANASLSQCWLSVGFLETVDPPSSAYESATITQTGHADLKAMVCPWRF
jgi:hypothetical protein